VGFFWWVVFFVVGGGGGGLGGVGLGLFFFFGGWGGGLLGFLGWGGFPPYLLPPGTLVICVSSRYGLFSSPASPVCGSTPRSPPKEV